MSSRTPLIAVAFASVGAVLWAWNKRKVLKEINVTKQLKELGNIHPEIVDGEDFLGIQVDPSAYLDLLGKLIGESEKLQNFPPEFIPQEGLAVKHVLNALSPYSTKNGGRLEITEYAYAEGRPNLVIK